MKASFVDLRNKSRQIIRALRRKERVTVLYRGKPAAIMQPIDEGAEKTAARAQDHAAFGLWVDHEATGDVASHVRKLRRGRLDAF